jgi:hypothetical protein
MNKRLQYLLKIYQEMPCNTLKCNCLEDFADNESQLAELLKFYTSRGFDVLVASFEV